MQLLGTLPGREHLDPCHACISSGNMCLFGKFFNYSMHVCLNRIIQQLEDTRFNEHGYVTFTQLCEPCAFSCLRACSSIAKGLSFVNTLCHAPKCEV